MFHQRLDPLSTYESAGIRVLRDCLFYAAGKIPTRLNNRLVPLGDRRYLRELNCNLEGVAGVLCTEDVAADIPSGIGCAITTNPVGALYKIHAQRLSEGKYWQSFPSQIHPDAKIHPNAHIDPRDVVIGPDTVVGPSAVIMERSIVGARCFIGAGTIVGTKAYEIGQIEGRTHLLPQAGGVLIGDDVVLLSNVTVAISIFPLFTEIRSQTTIDNGCHIAHDCILGEGTKVTAGVVLAGRVTLKDRAYLGPNSTISNGITVGAGSKVTIGSVVIEDVPDGANVSGNFAIPQRDHLRLVARSRRK